LYDAEPQQTIDVLALSKLLSVLSKLYGMGSRKWISLLVSLSVLLSAAFSSVCISAPGKHCRTAAVQKVQFLIAVEDAQGKLVLKPIDRAPKPGELSFKQCYCEDGKAAKNLKEVPTNVPLVWIVPAKYHFELSHTTPQLDCQSELPSMVSLATHPPIPPPDQA